jgi:undecaprenyl-diphosphatase
MSLIQAIILGIVQGLTEFLPISSSAHLVIVPYLLNWSLDPTQAFVFDVLVQLGTLTAVLVYFWKDLVSIVTSMISGLKEHSFDEKPEGKLGWMIILATIPAGLAGLLLKSNVEAAFNSPSLTSLMLLVTAGLLVTGEILSKKTRPAEAMTPLDALIVGLFQALSVFPGISRSGATITGGLLRHFKREDAARVSFLMTIPIMLAAGLLAMVDLFAIPALASFLPIVVVGFIVAAIVGYFAIRWFMGFLRQKNLYPFAIYCAMLALITLIITYVR